MRIFILLSVLLFTASFQANAQYKMNKHYYNYRDYVPHYDDKYNPGLCGAASFLVPGLGQVIARETGRGIAFFAGSMACYVLTYSGAMMMTNSYSSSMYSNDFDDGARLFLGGLAGMLAVDIWAIVDAVRVAKVNNMAINDLRKNTFRLQPSLNMTPKGSFVPGLAMGINF